jgi:hypothetical protein
MVFADDVEALAVEIERVAQEAAKRAAIRAAGGRHIPEALRGRLERSHRALGELLAIDAAPQPAMADRRASIESLLARLGGRP